MDMGPHMKMTALRPPKPGDAARAQQVADEARKASEKYTDYHTALADGYKIFHPEVPQKMYHFTNYGYAMEAAFRFNPDHPTSLLYEKHGDDYKLVGVMYTAPKRFTEDQLDERIPLSVAQWHEHVNFCAPPADRRKEMRIGTASAVRLARIDHHAGSLRRGGRNISSRDLQLDGAPLSVRKRSGEDLVGRAPARRRRLIPGARALPAASSGQAWPAKTNHERRRLPKFGELPDAELGLELDKTPPSSVGSRAAPPANRVPFCAVNSSHKTHA